MDPSYSYQLDYEARNEQQKTLHEEKQQEVVEEKPSINEDLLEY